MFARWTGLAVFCGYAAIVLAAPVCVGPAVLTGPLPRETGRRRPADQEGV